MKWISVKDKLPDPIVDVLVYDKKEEKVLLTFLVQLSQNEPWWHHNCFNVNSNTVTHWMYLPDPPACD